MDDGELFPVVLQEFDKWMKEDVGLNKQFLFVTCGDWDLKTMLPSQCALENLQVPPYCKMWLNIKKVNKIIIPSLSSIMLFKFWLLIFA